MNALEQIPRKNFILMLGGLLPAEDLGLVELCKREAAGCLSNAFNIVC